MAGRDLWVPMRGWRNPYSVSRPEGACIGGGLRGGSLSFSFYLHEFGLCSGHEVHKLCNFSDSACDLNALKFTLTTGFA
jgi:hypothetical protein